MAQSDADRIWNRAVMEAGGDSPAEGDRALAALMSLHNVAMNGGLLHSIEHHSDDEIARALDGYRYFGLDDARAVVEWTRREAEGIDLDADLDAAERLEVEADSRYAEAVADDDVLFRAFMRRLADDSGAFAPLT